MPTFNPGESGAMSLADAGSPSARHQQQAGMRLVSGATFRMGSDRHCREKATVAAHGEGGFARRRSVRSYRRRDAGCRKRLWRRARLQIRIPARLPARTNPIVMTQLFGCALSFAGAIFLVLELDNPFTGMMRISSATLRSALSPLDSSG